MGASFAATCSDEHSWLIEVIPRMHFSPTFPLLDQTMPVVNVLVVVFFFVTFVAFSPIGLYVTAVGARAGPTMNPARRQP